MVRGFTLMELLITLGITLTMLMTAVPSYSALSDYFKMTQLARSLESFLHQARAEAVYRNQDLWAHVEVSQRPDVSGEWQIWLSDSDESGKGAVLLRFSGQRYHGIAFESQFSSEQIKFDGVRGKIKNGSIYLYPKQHRERALRIGTSFGASRIKLCGLEGEQYGYPAC